MIINSLKSVKSFDGHTKYFEHASNLTKTTMKFSTFIPGKKKVKNAIIWLSGLTCTEENFITKSGVQKLLADTDTMIICPDTSPRGLELTNEHDSYDFGSGAGFYINATTDGYRDHYKMYDYIFEEITEILHNNFDIQNISIMGHSMGGHGALILGLKEKELYKAISAFSPITNPINCPWGQKAFKGYFGEQAQELALANDATEILRKGRATRNCILIEQGLDDEFLKEQLLTENFENICKEVGQELKVNYREGYDHSYFFIATYLEEHVQFHLEAFKEVQD
ncbi:S-formylglutathione hydrolase [Halobacteriovorax marinus]|uniref:S-formylglutathione hydrolase n=1 Tax=Halobacteriovorax marinus TaxID=97084 RepID=A0A1Y5F4J8_9BACT|nr:S-formylglutathione hydrolase [Halobacteriovorax marinus]